MEQQFIQKSGILGFVFLFLFCFFSIFLSVIMAIQMTEGNSEASDHPVHQTRQRLGLPRGKHVLSFIYSKGLFGERLCSENYQWFSTDYTCWNPEEGEGRKEIPLSDLSQRRWTSQCLPSQVKLFGRFCLCKEGYRPLRQQCNFLLVVNCLWFGE